MNPTNGDNKGTCTPVSSNCVIWQGDDIECLSLCKGDTITDVTFKLAVSYCEFKKIFDIANYDTSCLTPNCAPADFKALIQLMITKLCEAITAAQNSTSSSTSGCPTGCTVTIAECFYYLNNAGDTMTTMDLIDYVRLLGNTICEGQEQTVSNTAAVQNLGTRVAALEAKPDPTLTLPTIKGQCIDELVLDEFTKSLETAFCDLRNAIGTPTEIYQAIAKQPASLNQATRMGGPGTMSSISGWITQVRNMAESLNNMWLVVLDNRAAIQQIKLNCCPSICDDITVAMTASLPSSNTLKLYFSGDIPSNFANCVPAGTVINIADGVGGALSVTVNILAILNNPAGFTIDLTSTPLNNASDFYITGIICLRDTESGSTCSSPLLYNLVNTQSCPVMVLTPDFSEIGYQFTYNGGACNYTVKLYDGTGLTVLQTQSGTLTGPDTRSGSFVGLDEGTNYRVRVELTVNGITTTCEFVSTTTLATCAEPTNLTSQIIIE